MRPAVITAGLLLVLMPMLATRAWTPEEMCNTKYKEPCRNGMGRDWYYMGGYRCVKAFFHNNHLSFEDAEKACQKYPTGHLVSIKNIVELSVVECAMYRETTEKAHYWIGLRSDSNPLVEREFTWTDGSGPVTGFFYWASGQPDNSMCREHCVEMNYWSWGLWNDERCDAKRPYVCAVKI